MNIEITLEGYLIGETWMPSIVCAKALNVNLTRERGRVCDSRHPVGFKASLRDVIELVVSENGGDFQHCKLTKDSFIQARIRSASNSRVKIRSRDWPITTFPSLKDYIDERELFEIEDM